MSEAKERYKNIVVDEEALGVNKELKGRVVKRDVWEPPEKIMKDTFNAPNPILAALRRKS